MATAQDVVRRALVLIGAIEAGESASAGEMKDGVDSLNDMLFGWAALGADLVHETLAQGETLLVDDSFLEGIRFNLAVRIAPEYGATVPAYVSELARETFAAFQAHTLEFDDDLQVDRALHPRHFNRRIGAYNVDEG